MGLNVCLLARHLSLLDHEWLCCKGSVFPHALCYLSFAVNCVSDLSVFTRYQTQESPHPVLCQQDGRQRRLVLGEGLPAALFGQYQRQTLAHLVCKDIHSYFTEDDPVLLSEQHVAAIGHRIG